MGAKKKLDRGIPSYRINVKIALKGWGDKKRLLKDSLASELSKPGYFAEQKPDPNHTDCFSTSMYVRNVKEVGKIMEHLMFIYLKRQQLLVRMWMCVFCRKRYNLNLQLGDI